MACQSQIYALANLAHLSLYQLFHLFLLSHNLLSICRRAYLPLEGPLGRSDMDIQINCIIYYENRLEGRHAQLVLIYGHWECCSKRLRHEVWSLTLGPFNTILCPTSCWVFGAVVLAFCHFNWKRCPFTQSPTPLLRVKSWSNCSRCFWLVYLANV